MLTDTKKNEALGELNSGTTAKEVAKKYGVSYNTVLSWKQRQVKSGSSFTAGQPTQTGFAPQNLREIAGAVRTLEKFNLI